MNKKDRFLRGNNTYEGHTFALFRQTAKLITLAWVLKTKIA